MARHKQKPSNIDTELAQHCLENVGSVTSPSCPISSQRATCQGLGLTDTFFGWLVEAVKERNALESKVDKDKPKIKNVIRYERATAQIASMSYMVAMIENPYNPDPEDVLLRAEMDATEAVEG